MTSETRQNLVTLRQKDKKLVDSGAGFFIEDEDEDKDSNKGAKVENDQTDGQHAHEIVGMKSGHSVKGRRTTSADHQTGEAFMRGSQKIRPEIS